MKNEAGKNETTPSKSAVEGLVKRYILDLSQVAKEDLPERFIGGPVIIPLREGLFECDYDVIEDELPRYFIEKWRSFSDEPGKIKDWPLGINKDHLKRMPEGAILRDA